MGPGSPSTSAAGGGARANARSSRRRGVVALGILVTVAALVLVAWLVRSDDRRESLVWTRVPVAELRAPAVFEDPDGAKLDGPWRLVNGYGAEATTRLVKLGDAAEPGVVRTYTPVAVEDGWRAWTPD